MIQQSLKWWIILLLGILCNNTVFLVAGYTGGPCAAKKRMYRTEALALLRPPSTTGRTGEHILRSRNSHDGLLPHPPMVPNEGSLSYNRRRSLLLLGGALFLVPTRTMADTGAEVRGTPVNAFNGLAFQYRGSDFGGLRAVDIDEPSIPYSEFVSKLQTGDISMVEFLAPDGDVAYATLKNSANKIRIGEGYPIEQHDGYSSPAFAIRTVKNAGVPYRFIVPALSKTQ